MVGASVPEVAVAASWRVGAAMLALVAVAGVALSAAFKELPTPATRLPQAVGNHRPLSPLAWYLTAYAVFMGWGVSAIVAFLPLYAYESLSMRPQLAGLLTGVIGLLGAVSRIGIGVLTNSARQLALWLVVLAAAATASTPLLLAAAGLPHLAWLAVIGLGAGALAWQTPAMLAIVRQKGELHAHAASSWRASPVCSPAQSSSAASRT